MTRRVGLIGQPKNLRPPTPTPNTPPATPTPGPSTPEPIIYTDVLRNMLNMLNEQR